MLGRNLEGLVSRAQEQRTAWKDSHVSVEHLVLAFLDDTRFGAGLLKNGNLSMDSLTKAIKEIRGSNRVTDQVKPEAALWSCQLANGHHQTCCPFACFWGC